MLISTFCLTILGTYLTRSGILSSVHAFGDGPVGNYLLGFFGVAVTAVIQMRVVAQLLRREEGTADRRV